MRGLFSGIGALILLLAAGCGGRGREGQAETAEVVVGDFEVWTPFQGVLDSMRSESVASSISQPAALLMLAPEGAEVEPGDVVAVLDTSSLEDRLATLERDRVLAGSEVRTLTEADIPLRRAKLASDLREARNTLAQEEAVGTRMASLAEEGLISDGELAGYQTRVRTLRETVAGLETQIRLHEEVIFPSQTQQATARMESAERQLTLVREQMDGARITATLAGRVVHLPLHVQGEFRTVREGDSLYRNQEFMRVADMGQLVVRCEVPESRLSRVPSGAPVRVIPDAFPDLVLEGQVFTVSSVAVRPSGRPAHMKTFTVTLLLEDADPRLRMGMTMRAHILSERHPQSLLVPRAFVGDVNGVPHVWKDADSGGAPRAVTLGGGNETHFRIVEGVEAGTVLVRPPVL